MSNTSNIVESIRTYVLGCGMLKKGAMHVSYLGSKPTNYSIDVLPCAPVVTKYTDGGSLRQFQFAFTSREHYTSDDRDMIENSGFYEDLSDWFEVKSEAGELPKISDTRKSPQRIEVMTSGYLFDSDEDVARYQIQCRLLYLQEGY